MSWILVNLCREVRDSPPTESLCCVLEQETVLVQPRKTLNRPDLTETVDWDVMYQNQENKHDWTNTRDFGTNGICTRLLSTATLTILTVFRGARILILYEVRAFVYFDTLRVLV